MTAQVQTLVSEAEYLELEERSTVKHEYFNGEVFAMAGGSNAHAQLCTNLSGALFNALRGKPCRPVNSEQRVKVQARGLLTYPDASVYCLGAKFEGRGDQTLLDPKVIFEVLSPSTESYDRTDKFNAYQAIATLTDYVLIAQNRVYVEHFHRVEDGWLLRSYSARENVLALPEISAQLRLSDIYDALNVPEGVLSVAEPRDESRA